MPLVAYLLVKLYCKVILNFSAPKKKKKEKKKSRIWKPETDPASEQAEVEKKENENKEPATFTLIGQNIKHKKTKVKSFSNSLGEETLPKFKYTKTLKSQCLKKIYGLSGNNLIIKLLRF